MKVKLRNMAIIVGITILSLLSLNSSSFAFTENDVKTEGDTLTRTFNVDSLDEINFKSFINSDSNKEYQDEKGNTYTFQGIERADADGNSKNVTDVKVLNNLSSNDESTILNQAGNTLNYNKDGYEGTLNYTNMQVTEVDQGTYQRILSLNIPFSGYSQNDLNNIDKTINRNGRNWTLINVDWTPDNTREVDGTQVPVTYRGTMHYQTVATYSNPKKYNVTINYSGNVTKDNPNYIYTATYKKETPIPVEEPKQETNYSPIIITVSGLGILLIIVLAYYLSKNAEIYSQNAKGQYELIKKVHISSNNPKVNLTSGTLPSNLLKLALKDSIYNKISGGSITIKLNNITKTIKVTSKNIDFTM